MVVGEVLRCVLFDRWGLFMNLVGKIFTVLIFLMCVVFASFALMVHAAHKNWKVETLSLSQKLTEANQQKKDLSDEKVILQTTLDNERKQIQKTLIALENEKKIVTADRDQKEQKLQLEEGRSPESPRPFKRFTSGSACCKRQSTACGTTSRSPWMSAFTPKRISWTRPTV